VSIIVLVTKEPIPRKGIGICSDPMIFFLRPVDVFLHTALADPKHASDLPDEETLPMRQHIAFPFPSPSPYLDDPLKDGNAIAINASKVLLDQPPR
jgi:hypothetical protein